MLRFEEETHARAKIAVVGVGGAGCNAVNTMIAQGLAGVSFVAANTDAQALAATSAPVKIQLGSHLTKGLGAGADPDVGRSATLESRDLVRDVLAGADMVFVTAGLGGGTGTGGAPVIAEVGKDLGALTVGVVTKPFHFEGAKRMRRAEAGLAELKRQVDTLVTIPNERLLGVAGKSAPLLTAFRVADEVLFYAVKGIADLITVPGLINLDFADVRTVMLDMGLALMGTGVATGEHRAVEAAQHAIASPLLEDATIQGARGVLLNVTGPSTMTLFEITEAATLIQEEAHEEANIIFGAVIDETMGEMLRVTVIATGFDGGRPQEKLDLGKIGAAPLARRDDKEIPAYLRRDRVQETREALRQSRQRVTTLPADNYDIPAFLRKHVD